MPRPTSFSSDRRRLFGLAWA